MTEDAIPKNGFQLSRLVREKEGLVERIKNSLKKDYGLAALSGAATVVLGLATVYELQQDNLTVAVTEGLFTLANIGSLLYTGRVITGKQEQIRKLEAELEYIKENPAYRASGF